MNYNEMIQAVREAEETLRLADLATGKVARLLIGRLRMVDDLNLCALKRELKNYNMQTGQWRD